MKRRFFIKAAGAAILTAGTATYFVSDKKGIVRTDVEEPITSNIGFRPDEKKILYLASLAPSGHNTQPWLVRYVGPYHWVICNDKTKWLPVVDPNQRETILSIGAFIQNLEFSASQLGYSCQFRMLASSNQDKELMEVLLRKQERQPSYDIQKIVLRRTVKSGYIHGSISKEHIHELTSPESDWFNYIPIESKAYEWINEQTIEANKVQTNHDEAQAELAEWIRFSNKEALSKCDGLTTDTMEIDGLPGWFIRNFYNKKLVMSKSFRVQGIDKIRAQVNRSGGWLLLSSKDNSTESLIETGKRFQRVLLEIRQKNIAIHPMTQTLEEDKYRVELHNTLGILNPIQFVLRIGYVEKYPGPVSLRRSVDKFIFK
ncbi:MAG: hypothetical protein K1X55_17950 [Chitinophagales bacterium]|nr:hypothetical protein [Chitinophagales bacterium]